MLLYSITDSESFEEVKRLRESVEEIKKLGFGVAIVGNKKDLEHFRKVGEYNDQITNLKSFRGAIT